MASIRAISGTLGKKRAAHLLRRITFGPSAENIERYAQMTIEVALTELLQPYQVAPLPPVDPQTGETWLQPRRTAANTEEFDLIHYFIGWWLELMRTSQNQGIERMTFFLHTHFTMIKSKVSSSAALYYQNVLMRHYALGNFKELVRKTCVDNAMLKLLDGNLNQVGRPNENFARELLELYTIGKGQDVGPGNYTNYTEDDIREAAKVLSGFTSDDDFLNIDPELGIPMGILIGEDVAQRHDAGVKSFSAAFQNKTISPSEIVSGKATANAAWAELDEFLDMIFEQEATAKYICRKLYRFFVYYNITEEIENDVIEELTATFRTNNYELRPVVEQLLKSEHFYDDGSGENEDDNFGAIIKSPVELFVGTSRYFNIDFPVNDLFTLYKHVYQQGLLNHLELQGMELYEPYDVAGYDAYHQFPEYNRNWITSNTLARRYDLINILMEGGFRVRMDVVGYVRELSGRIDVSDSELLVRELVDTLLPEAITVERFSYYHDVIFLDGLSPRNWLTEWNSYLQNGKDTVVKGMLEALLKAILQSPEYQLF